MKKRLLQTDPGCSLAVACGQWSHADCRESALWPGTENASQETGSQSHAGSYSPGVGYLVGISTITTAHRTQTPAINCFKERNKHGLAMSRH